MSDELNDPAGVPEAAVSRETPPTPDVARQLFSSARLPLAEAYAGWLADAGTVRGLIGPGEVPRLWERHLLNCAALGEAVPVNATVCDLGSGAGLPGLVLAIARPDLHITLVEPLLRRTTFLQEVVADLDLDGVEVIRGRADDLHGRRTFDVVTSRAVAPLERLLRWSMPLVAADGALVAMKGSSFAEEIVAAERVLADYRCGRPEPHHLGAGLGSPTTLVVRVAWADPGRVGWPLVPRTAHDPPRSRGRR